MCGLDLQLINIEHKMVKLIHSTKDKKFIVINARTHSGETSSSWVLDGLIEEISNSPMIEEWMLAENICFKIIPMLNPDGVFIGNYRTGIIGDDFNRKFNTGRK
jgi:murein tripeptide amidase MpaA